MKQRKPNYRDDPTTGPARGRRQAPPMRLQAERAEQMARARRRLLERRGAGASPLAVERMARRIELQRSRLLAGGRPSRSGPRFLGWQSARRELWQVPFGSHEVRAWYDPGTRMVATVLPAAGGPLRLRQPLHPEWVAPARRRDPRRQA